MTAVEEHAHLIAVAPYCRAAQFPPAARQDLPELIRGAVEAPALFAGFGVERSDAVVRRGDVERAVDHQRRRLELAGYRVVFLEWRFPVFPLPRRLQLLD